MTLPASGQISLQQIATEFGKPLSSGLTTFYGITAGIPGSGAISFSNFYGKSAGYQYWRIFMVDNNGSSSYVFFAEIELAETIGGPDVTTPSTPVTASSTLSTNFLPEKTIDNITDSSTYWLPTSNTNQWVRYNLGTPKNIVQMRIYPYNGSYTYSPKNFRLEASNDDVNFTPIITVSSYNSWGVQPSSTFNKS